MLVLELPAQRLAFSLQNLEHDPRNEQLPWLCVVERRALNRNSVHTKRRGAARRHSRI
jgi:hypothetical protein